MATKANLPVGSEEAGAEFLTWLWHAGVEGEERVFDGTTVRVALGDLIKLRALDGSGPEVTIKGEHAGASAEMFSALHRKALIMQARIQLDLGGTVVAAVIKGQTLALSGVKLPKEPPHDTGTPVEAGERAGLEADDDRSRLEDEARLLSRMAWLDQAQAAVDKLFDEFLQLRSGNGWKAWRQAFEKWVAQRVADHGV